MEKYLFYFKDIKTNNIQILSFDSEERALEFSKISGHENYLLKKITDNQILEIHNFMKKEIYTIDLTKLN